MAIPANRIPQLSKSPPIDVKPQEASKPEPLLPGSLHAVVRRNGIFRDHWTPPGPGPGPESGPGKGLFLFWIFVVVVVLFLEKCHLSFVAKCKQIHPTGTHSHGHEHRCAGRQYRRRNRCSEHKALE